MSVYGKVIHPISKEVLDIKLGFSWVTLFFGIFVPLIRGHFTYFFVLLALCFIGGLGIFIAWFICPFFINETYYKWLISKGYIPLKQYKEQLEKEKEEVAFKKAMMDKMLSE
jgi:hypothetical protein